MKKLSTKSKVPWFYKIKNKKVICRRAELRWLKTRKQVDLDNFKTCRNFLHRTIHESKSQYYTNLINADTSKNRLIKNSSNKQCILDPIPTRLLMLKECNSELFLVITEIINLSIETSTEQPVVTPLAKLEYKNYRPVSNLPCISKLLGKR